MWTYVVIFLFIYKPIILCLCCLDTVLQITLNTEMHSLQQCCMIGSKLSAEV